MAADLVALGDTLEAAAVRDLKRRRGRRQLFLNGLASVAIAAPLALSLLSTGVSRPSVSGEPQPAAATHNIPTAARVTLAWTPADRLAVGHIPDERLLPAKPVAQCLGGEDCRVPIPYTLHAPLGKV
jgi:hypothetical protein